MKKPVAKTLLLAFYLLSKVLTDFLGLCYIERLKDLKSAIKLAQAR